MSTGGFLIAAAIFLVVGLLTIAVAVRMDRQERRAEARRREAIRKALQSVRPEYRAAMAQAWPEDYRELVEEVEREQRSEEQA